VGVLRLVSIAVPFVTDPAAWTATSFASAADYTLILTDTGRNELLAALHNIERRGRLRPPTKLTVSDFELQELGPRLEQAFEQVRCGCGLVVGFCRAQRADQRA
jgi:hypothetical protein